MTKKNTDAVKVTPEATSGPTTEMLFPGFEVIVGALISTYGDSLGKAVYKAVKGDKTHLIQIKDSWKDGEYYHVAISFLNLTVHGIYLENLWVKDPLNLPLYLCGEPAKVLNFGSKKPEILVSEWLPRLIPAGQSSPTELLLRLTDDNKSSLSGRDTFTLGYTISQLDQDKSDDDLEIRVRRRGNKSGKEIPY